MPPRRAVRAAVGGAVGHAGGRAHRGVTELAPWRTGEHASMCTIQNMRLIPPIGCIRCWAEAHGGYKSACNGLRLYLLLLAQERANLFK